MAKKMKLPKTAYIEVESNADGTSWLNAYTDAKSAAELNEVVEVGVYELVKTVKVSLKEVIEVK